MPPSVDRAFSYTIDTNVRPFDLEALRRSGLPPRPLAAVLEPGGIVTSFVVNEIVFEPTNAQDLAQFVQRYRGVVVDPGTVPPRRNAQGQPIEQPSSAGFVVVTVDLSQADLSTLAPNAARIGASGLYRFSSPEAVQLFAIVAAEHAAGRGVGTNVIFPTHSVTKPCAFRTTFEAPIATTAPDHTLANLGFADGFAQPWIADPGIRVGEAWQLVAETGRANERVYVFVIDDGFSPNTDFRDDFGSSVQYDFNDHDYDATGAYPGKCGCPWHGTAVASAASAVLDNQFGVAGTGGQVAVPILFKTDDSFSQAARAVRTATKWHGSTPAVINMSFGGSCGFWCYEKPFRDAVNDAAAAGVIPIASAGNDSTPAKVVDVHESAIAPCKYDGAVCVGAIGGDRRRASFSNAGKKVDIWAPGVNVRTTPDPSSSGAAVAFSGTSAAAPFVAGIVAMMKATNPFLSRDAIVDILRSTASVSSDPLVSPGFVNALAAVNRSKGFSRVSTHFEGTGVKWHDSFGVGDEFVAVGDFNGDCRDDIVTFTKGTDGHVFVALAAGSMFAGTGVVWHNSFCLGAQVCAVGDFDGDGKDDIASFDQSTGIVRVARSTGSSFGPPEMWHTSFSRRPGQTILVGDFNSTSFPPDEKDDIAVVVRGNDAATLAPGEVRGEVYVALSTGSGFGARTRWNDFFAPGAEIVAAADVDGDGRADLISFLQDCCPEPDRGDVYVTKSIGSSFLPAVKWNDFFSLGGEIAAAGNFSAPGRADIVTFVHDVSGHVYVGRNTDGAFGEVLLWHDRFCIETQICRVGDFNGDGRADVAAFTRGDAADVFVALSQP